MLAHREMWEAHNCPYPGSGCKRGRYTETEGLLLNVAQGEKVMRVAVEEKCGKIQERCLDCDLVIVPS